MRILRDVSELWKFRSLIKAAATRRFTYFPDIGWLMAFLWHIHQHPVRCLMAFFSLSAGVLGYVIFIVEVQQERPGDCSLLAEDVVVDNATIAVGGIIDVAQRCSQQVVKTYPQAVWLAMTTMFQVLYGDYIPTSHVARIMCAIATSNRRRHPTSHAPPHSHMFRCAIATSNRRCHRPHISLPACPYI